MYCPACGSKAKFEPNKGATACNVCNSYYVVKYDGQVVPSVAKNPSVSQVQPKGVTLSNCGLDQTEK